MFAHYGVPLFHFHLKDLWSMRRNIARGTVGNKMEQRLLAAQIVIRDIAVSGYFISDIIILEVSWMHSPPR